MENYCIFCKNLLVVYKIHSKSLNLNRVLHDMHIRKVHTEEKAP